MDARIQQLQEEKLEAEGGPGRGGAFQQRPKEEAGIAEEKSELLERLQALEEADRARRCPGSCCLGGQRQRAHPSGGGPGNSGAGSVPPQDKVATAPRSPVRRPHRAVPAAPPDTGISHLNDAAETKQQGATRLALRKEANRVRKEKLGDMEFEEYMSEMLALRSIFVQLTLRNQRNPQRPVQALYRMLRSYSLSGAGLDHSEFIEALGDFSIAIAAEELHQLAMPLTTTVMAQSSLRSLWNF